LDGLIHVAGIKTLAPSPFTVILVVFGGYLSMDKIRRFLPKTRRNEHIKEGGCTLVEETALFLW